MQHQSWAKRVLNLHEMPNLQKAVVDDALLQTFWRVFAVNGFWEAGGSGGHHVRMITEGQQLAAKQAVL